MNLVILNILFSICSNIANGQNTSQVHSKHEETKITGGYNQSNYVPQTHTSDYSTFVNPPVLNETRTYEGIELDDFNPQTSNTTNNNEVVIIYESKRWNEYKEVRTCLYRFFNSTCVKCLVCGLVFFAVICGVANIIIHCYSTENN